jgi:hypothetical protein
MTSLAPKGGMLVVLLAALSSAVAADEVKERLPVPSDADQNVVVKVIADIYKGDYEKAKTSERRIELAKKMLADARATKNDAVGRYVLLRITRDAAAQSGDEETSFAAIAEIARGYTVDLPLMKSDVIRVLATKNHSAEVYQRLYLEANSLTDAWVVGDRYDLAVPLLQSLLPAARKLKDPAALKQLMLRVKEVEEIEKEHGSVKASLGTLATNARDGEANLTVGRFLCFQKGDWAKGLPHLALASDKTLASLAAAELGEKPDRLALGDGWWEQAEKSDGVSKQNLQRHAAECYRTALTGLSGLAKVRAEKRLAEIDKKVAAEIPTMPKVVDKDGPASLELKKIADLEGHDPRSGIWHVAFSPDGKLLAANDRDTIMIWDVTKRVVKSRLVCADRIQSLAWSHDGKLIAAGRGPSSIEVWNVAEEKRISTLDNAGFTRVRFSPDDTLIAASTGSTINFWRPTGKLVSSPRGEGFAFSPTQKVVAVVSEKSERKITIASYLGGGEIVIDMPEGSCRSLEYLPDGRTLALLYMGKSRVDFLDVAQRRIKLSLPVGVFGARGIAISSDGSVIAVLEDPNALVLWNTKTGRELLRLGDRNSDDDDVFSIGFSSDGKTLAMGARKGLQLWEMTYGKP